MSEQITEEYVPRDLEQTVEHDSALPVRIVKEPGEQTAAPEHVSWSTLILTGAEQASQLLTFSRKRSKANINIMPAVGAVGTQYVRLGRQTQSGSPNGGGLFAAPVSLSYGAQPEVWVIPQAVNGAVIITVEEERYE